MSSPEANVPALGYENYWYPAVFSSELGRKPVAVRLLGEGLVLFRGNGAVHALEDRCVHRRAKLSKGWIRAEGTLTCAYHGWTYDGAGRCIAALNEGPESPVRLTASVRSFPAQERGSVIWVYMGVGEAPPLEEDLPAPFVEPGYTILGESQEWDCDWRLGVENSIDPSHALILHRNSLRMMFLRLPARRPIGVSETPDGRGLVICRQSGPESDSHEGFGVWPPHEWWRFIRRKPPKAGASTKINVVKLNYDSQLLLPGFVELPLGRAMVFIHWHLPIGEGRSRHFLWTAKRCGNGLGRLAFRLYYWLWYKWLMNKNFIGQDRWLLAGQEYGGERFSREDISIIQWRKLLPRRARGAKPVLSPEDDAGEARMRELERASVVIPGL